MNYRAQLDDAVLRKIWQFPPDAFDELIAVFGAIAADPYDAMHSYPVEGDRHRRWTVLSEHGFAEFEVNDVTGVLLVTDITWAG